MSWQPPWAHGHTGLNGLSGLHGLYGLSSRNWYNLAGLMALWAADDESGLIAMARQGDRAAIDQLFEHYRPQLVRFLRGKILTDPLSQRGPIADDIANETLIKLYANIGKFDPSRGVKFSTWMFAIARNTAIDRYRKIQREKARQEKAAGRVSTVGDESELTERVESAGGEEAKRPKWQEGVFALLVSNPQMMQSILEKMTPLQREAFRLREIERLSYAQIAQRLNIPLGTAARRVMEARDAIDKGFLKAVGQRPPETRIRRRRS